MDELPFEEYKFSSISLEQVQQGLQTNLCDYFQNVDVSVMNCPDLTKSPFNLASKGFGHGEIGILDLGGVPYLIPTVKRHKIYDLTKIVPKYVNLGENNEKYYISGPGAGPWPSQNQNCELIANILIKRNGDVIENKSKIALTKSNPDGSSSIIVKSLERNETRCALLANLMVSDGIPGKILCLRCSIRKGSENFTESIRKSLIKSFEGIPIGLCGFFLVNGSLVKIHVMQDFSKIPLITQEDVDNWLRFFQINPPMMFQSVLTSIDPGLDLRMDHSHGWNIGEDTVHGGHYHYDTQSQLVEYVGYFAIATKIWRIDRPSATHQVGRD